MTLFAVKGAFAPGAATPPLKVEELPAPAEGRAGAPPPQQTPGQVRQPRGLAADAKGRDLGRRLRQRADPGLREPTSRRSSRSGRCGAGPGEFQRPLRRRGGRQGPRSTSRTRGTAASRSSTRRATFQREFGGGLLRAARRRRGREGRRSSSPTRATAASCASTREGTKEAAWGRRRAPGSSPSPQGVALGEGRAPLRRGQRQRARRRLHEGRRRSCARSTCRAGGAR